MNTKQVAKQNQKSKAQETRASPKELKAGQVGRTQVRTLTEHTVKLTMQQYNLLPAKERKSEGGSYYKWDENQWKRVEFVKPA